jgi:hypothetical protein
MKIYDKKVIRNKRFFGILFTKNKNTFIVINLQTEYLKQIPTVNILNVFKSQNNNILFFTRELSVGDRGHVIVFRHVG